LLDGYEFIRRILVNYGIKNGDISPFDKRFYSRSISSFHVFYFQDRRELANAEKVLAHYKLVISITSSSFTPTSVFFVFFFLQPFWKIC